MKVNVAAGIDFSLEVDDAVLARVLNCNRATVQRTRGLASLTG
jgi:hypothetical protein